MQRRLRVWAELPPPGAQGRFEQQHTGTCLARHQGGAQGGIAAADHQHIDHSIAAHGRWLQGRCAARGGMKEGGVGPMGCLLARVAVSFIGVMATVGNAGPPCSRFRSWGITDRDGCGVAAQALVSCPPIHVVPNHWPRYQFAHAIRQHHTRGQRGERKFFVRAGCTAG